MTNAELGFTQSLWWATAEAAPETAALVGDVRADVVIVGAGFTGLSAALHLAEAGQSVTVVEAKDIGWGASGRNGGQVNPAFDVLPSGVRTHYGEARGNRVLALVDSACDLVFDLIKRHGIQCAHRARALFTWRLWKARNCRSWTLGSGME
jgi:glycine/D-amino acid oxidase-like deaminating enzyme